MKRKQTGHAFIFSVHSVSFYARSNKPNHACVNIRIEKEVKMFHNKEWNSSREISSYDVAEKNADVIELYDKSIETGDESEYQIFMWEKLKELVYSHIHKNHFDKLLEMEDLVSSAKTGILEELPKYNPHLSMPSSFFSIRIDQYLKEAVHENSHMHDHYIQKAIRLNKIAKEYKYEDALDPRLTPEKLAMLSGESLITIQNTLEQMQISQVALLDTNESSTKSELFRNPEAIAIDHEDGLYLQGAFDSLLPYERYIIEKLYLDVKENGKGQSLRTLVTFFHEPKNRQKYGVVGIPDTNTIQNDAERALRKLRHYQGMQERFGYRRKRTQIHQSYSVVKQAPDGIILSAVCDKNEVVSLAKAE